MADKTFPEQLREIAEDRELLWRVGRRAVEDTLVELRDSGISLLGRRNGVVIYSKEGEPSNIIRLGTNDALHIALNAIADHLEKGDTDVRRP